jgi:hypothetical protein
MRTPAGGGGGLGSAPSAERVRAEFVGELVTSRLTGELELRYPRWKRALKLAVTVPVLLLQLAALSVVVGLLYGAWIAIHLSTHHRPVKVRHPPAPGQPDRPRTSGALAG